MTRKTISQLTEELTLLSPTMDEVEEICRVNHEDFIVDNTQRDNHNHHIHIGFHTDAYLGRDDAEHLIQEIRKRRV
jgi:hypothetical protein